ncbi:ATP-dependent DNA helicase [Anaerocolumna sp. AGMB13020]|uniref:ATP-dependent DNA helicase n=1 Tax=Anaerocolumna sp. AGMB13020 TaxID=3081750 RepID=UPI002953721F|nr:ATP-dependent DNA helicase [Anaerocolumna sp. AGMB13020]WOO35243.1 ATP-dependent DNA helicase [Anaerocolumna sp. AGMB13020]
MSNTVETIKISVRNLVEFIMRSGDLDNRTGGRKEAEAMQEGSRIHRKIQKQMGSNYTAEVPLSITLDISLEEISFQLVVEGRADGILKEESEIVIDEIKGMYIDLSYLEEPISVHRAQAMCYAYIYAQQNSLESIGICMTYCNLDTEEKKYFKETIVFTELSAWFEKLTGEYIKWAYWQIKWNHKRNDSIKELEFPFTYRDGQKKLVSDVYVTLLRSKRLFIEAPTGVGKTISTVFPAIKAMGEGLGQKLFYLTAKTITRTVAEETKQLLTEKGLLLKAVTITAKDKICIFDKADCNPVSCPRAKGHFDRVNDAVYDMLVSEDDISREKLLHYAEKHQVCPFEMSLDTTTWSDMIICDYNYVFDPNVYLKRFFQNDKKNDYIILIDEAHNLVDRAREMYSAQLYKEEFLQVKRLIKGKDKALEKALDTCNSDLLKLKRECDDLKEWENISDFVIHLMHLMSKYEDFLAEHKEFDGKEEVLLTYMNIRHFINIYDVYNEKYITYTDYNEQGDFRIKLLCLDPSDNLSVRLDKVRSAVFFSATFLPIRYYKEQLGGREEDYAVYAPSPFQMENRLVAVGMDVSTKYTRRNEKEYLKIIQYIKDFTDSRQGNYMVFFPSYQMLFQVEELSKGILDNVIVQGTSMTEEEKETFLNDFSLNPDISRIAFCVMGGVFSEGIDLKHDRLIGAVIVGAGLPMVSGEKELFRKYYQETKNSGFEYAYLYQGMNKVLQSAGRVIRTTEDKGAILLLEERFLDNRYQELFPREWFPYQVVKKDEIKEVMLKFWQSHGL